MDTPWLDCALKEEEAGIRQSGSNGRILSYLATCSDLSTAELANDSTPWCAAFANWCMMQSGFAGANTSWARDWFDWGVPDRQPGRGSVVVWKRVPQGATDAVYGHVSFLLEDKGSELLVLGGNQARSVCRLLYPREGILRGDKYCDIAFRKPL